MTTRYRSINKKSINQSINQSESTLVEFIDGIIFSFTAEHHLKGQYLRADSR